jgi:hypothetical protein
MRMVFDSSDRWGRSMVEVAFDGLCNRQPGNGGKEREDECNDNQIKVEYVGGRAPGSG